MRRRTLVAAAAAAPWACIVHAENAASDARPVIAWPDIQLLDGGVLSPASWHGQAAVVVFWATYCPFCKRHNAHVDKLYRANRGQPLRVLGLALDGDAGSVRHYMASNHYAFPVALDGGDLRRRLTPRRVIPMTCVIDRQGRLLQAIPGEMLEDDVLGLARTLQRQPA
jgi:thiol-disulfide isomerase/thioredoxin